MIVLRSLPEDLAVWIESIVNSKILSTKKQAKKAKRRVGKSPPRPLAYPKGMLRKEQIMYSLTQTESCFTDYYGQKIKKIIKTLEKYYFISNTILYPKLDFVPASAPLTIEEITSEDSAQSDELRGIEYIFFGREGVPDTIETGIASMLLKKRSKNLVRQTYGSPIMVYDRTDRIFRQARFRRSDHKYVPKAGGKYIDPELLRIEEAPFFVICPERVDDLVNVVGIQRRPNTILAVGELHKGAYLESSRKNRYILPLVRFHTDPILSTDEVIATERIHVS